MPHLFQQARWTSRRASPRATSVSGWRFIQCSLDRLSSNCERIKEAVCPLGFVEGFQTVGARSEGLGNGWFVLAGGCNCVQEGGHDLLLRFEPGDAFVDFDFHEGSPVKVNEMPIESRPAHSGGETLAPQAAAAEGDRFTEGWAAHGHVARAACPYAAGERRRDWLAGWDASCELCEAGFLGWQAETGRPIPIARRDADDLCVDYAAERWLERQVAELRGAAPLH